MIERTIAMKKKILVCAMIVICLSVVAYSTLAYFTHEDTATNVITAGNIEIDLLEWAIDEESGERIPYDDVYDVMPGTDVSKIVEVKNTGDNAAWIRISVSKALLLADGVDIEADLSLVTYDLNTDKWTEKDGYYYYNEALEAGETTEPLFTEVHFAAEMTNEYQNSIAIINVDAQATQVANNGTSALDAAGWPAAE